MYCSWVTISIVTVTIVGCLFQLGIHSISSSYTRVYHFPYTSETLSIADIHFDNNIENSYESILKRLESETDVIFSSIEGWTTVVNDTSLFSQSKPILGRIHIAENPVTRVNISTACSNATDLFHKLISKHGMIALSPMISHQIYANKPIGRLVNNMHKRYVELRAMKSSLIWPFYVRNYIAINEINWEKCSYVSQSLPISITYKMIDDFNINGSLIAVSSREAIESNLKAYLKNNPSDNDGSFSSTTTLRVSELPCQSEECNASSNKFCNIAIMSHSVGMLPNPAIAHYYNSEYVPTQLLKYLEQIY